MARPRLTRSQQQVIGLAIVGHGTSEIAQRLGVDASSVQRRLQHARERLRARNNMELVARAMDLGLIEPPRQPQSRPS